MFLVNPSISGGFAVMLYLTMNEDVFTIHTQGGRLNWISRLECFQRE